MEGVMSSLVFLFVLWFRVSVGISVKEYTDERNKMIQEEGAMFLGAQLVLNNKEELVNEILMTAKRIEYDNCFQDMLFPPARHFFHAKSDIDNSDVFRIIKKMPKGAVLHGHDTAMVSEDYLIQNLTYRDNLYACNNTAGKLLLHFWSSPDDTCNWILVSDMRKTMSPSDVDVFLRSQLSLIVPNPRETYPDINKVWSVFKDIFITANGMILYAPVFRDYYYQTLKELYEDNVMYLELRGVLPEVYELNGTIHDQASVLKMYEEVTAQFRADHPDFLGARFIYAPLRSVNNSVVENYIEEVKTLKKAFPDFLAGFDLVGQEDLGKSLLDFIPQLLTLPEDIKVFYHAGETDWLGLTDYNIFDAILLNATRIGHGYGLCKHPLAKKLASEQGIAVEVSPISNQVLLLVDDLRNHPASVLMAEGFPIVISVDDPSFWGAKGLSYDFYEAFMGLAGFNGDLRTLKQLALNSLRYSAMDTDEKVRAETAFEEKWDVFLDDMLQPVSRQIRSAVCADVDILSLQCK